MVIGEADVSASIQKQTVKKKKQTPVKESSKKKSKTSAPYDDIKALDAKWSERFLRLEAMFMARTLQPPVGQLTIQHGTVSAVQPLVGEFKLLIDLL